MPEEQILVCRAVNPPGPGYVVSGSLPMKCQECATLVWVSPSIMLLLHDTPEMQIKCESCAFAHMSSHKGTSKRMDLTPGQMEEIEEYYRSQKQ